MARKFCSYAQKERFPNELEGNLALMAIQSNNRLHRKQKYREEPTRVYRCEHCGSWHLTSLKRGQSRRTVSN